MRAALFAGMYAARLAAIIITAAATRNVGGSNGLIAYGWLSTNRVR